MFNFLPYFLKPKTLVKYKETIKRPEMDLTPQINITDISMTLPWNPARKWQTRSLSMIDTIIVHQTAAVATLESVNNYHITPSPTNHISIQGCPHICYHYAINPDGQCYKLNEETDITWHAKSYNSRSIGILVNGKFRGPYTGIADFEGGEPTEAQIHNLKRLLDVLAKPFGRHVKGHCEVDPQNKSACPGYTVMDAVKQWRTENSGE